MIVYCTVCICYLLDIHLQQKDEFAIDQLLNHIRALGLDDILVQAEAQKQVFDEQNNKAIDGIDFQPTTPADLSNRLLLYKNQLLILCPHTIKR